MPFTGPTLQLWINLECSSVAEPVHSLIAEVLQAMDANQNKISYLGNHVCNFLSSTENQNKI